MKRNLEPYDNIVEVVGWTPLVRLRRIDRGLRTPIYGKAENLNPGGSVKDRIGLAIIEGAERRGELKPGGVVVEATRAATPASASRSRPRSRATAASSRSPTRCRARRSACCAPSAPR
jgi:Pyridoxal-phosphate dependent enzyme